ncbi:MAG: OFA family MFS transporter [Phycisphaerae bacterium]
MLHFLDKKRTIAGPGFNRWLVPPAALAIHLSIGMAYGFSVFWLPLSRAVGIEKSIHAPKDMSFWSSLFSTGYDWKISMLGWTFTLFFVLLGSSAAIFGRWLEHNGPRKAGVVAAMCWGGGFFIAALGVYTHQIVLLWIGSGVIGGCGLGLGYISPVSTLIKWFPDKRGMATGMAIMGFGGGAMIGSPLADLLMKFWSSPLAFGEKLGLLFHGHGQTLLKVAHDRGLSISSIGVWETFLTLGVLYLIAMLCGAFAYRIPPSDWKPHGFTGPASNGGQSFITQGHVHVSNAHKTPQFWFLWAILCLNVSAGIGVIGMASPMLQEVFGGRLIGIKAPLASLTNEQVARVASIGAGFAGLLSLFNIGGRIFWASLSDHLGRKTTYHIFFALGLVLYIAAALAGGARNVPLFVGLFCVILTMYGGGFSTIPAYLADLFGTQFVGAIHGRLLTAWATAGILGPVLVNYIREFQLDRGVPPESAYNVTLYALAGLLFLGFLSNLLVRPVEKHHFMSEDELEEEWQVTRLTPVQSRIESPAVESAIPTRASWITVGIGWTFVGIPLAWGVFKTVEKAASLFQ